MVEQQVGLALKPVGLPSGAEVIAPPPRKRELMGDEAGESSAIQSTFGEQPSTGPGKECRAGREPSQPTLHLSRQTDRPQEEELGDDSTLQGWGWRGAVSTHVVAAGSFCPQVACMWIVVSPGCRVVCGEPLGAFARDFFVPRSLGSAPWLLGTPGTNRANFCAISREEVPLLLRAWQITLRHSFPQPPSHGMPSITVASSPDECQQLPFSRERESPWVWPA